MINMVVHTVAETTPKEAARRSRAVSFSVIIVESMEGDRSVPAALSADARPMMATSRGGQAGTASGRVPELINHTRTRVWARVEEHGRIDVS
jgi:hypothetical protein